jgi:hypothetical protein
VRKEGIWRLLGGIERRFGRSIEALFPLKGGLQPADVVDALERTLADPRNRSPWHDGVIYAPNRYTVHLVCTDEQQRSFLFAFLTDAELARIARDYAQQEGYHFLTDPEFHVRVYEDAIPGHPEQVLWVEPGWVAPEALSDEHEQMTEPPPRARLVVEEGPDRGLEVLLRDAVVEIGRSRRMNNTVILSDTHVSRRHVRIEFAPDGSMIIENLRKGGNPMEVNGQPASRSELHFGDRVKLGSTVFIVQPPTAESPPSGEGPQLERPVQTSEEEP